MTRLHSPRALAWTVLGAALAAAYHPVQAETPLSLAVSQTLTYDSNVLRDNTRKYRDAISSTGVRVGFDKEYGRQTYQASFTGVMTRYKNTKEYDSDGYNARLGFRTTMASNWLLSASHTAVKQAQNPEDQGRDRYRENIESTTTQAFAQYGLYGRWSVNGTLSKSAVRYESREIYDKDSTAVKGGLRYSPTDLLYFDVGLRRTNTDSPKYPLFNNQVGDKVDRHDVDLSTEWTVTGYSRLSARVSVTRERHELDERRDFNGWTGSLAWNYTPRGKVSYSLTLNRDTNNAGGETFAEYNSAVSYFSTQNRLTTGLNLSATWRPTAKISANLGFTFRDLEEEQAQFFGTNSDITRVNGNYKSISMGLTYQFARSTTFSCSIDHYARSGTVLNREYDGDEVSCTASFTID